MEVDRDGPSYAYETLEALAEREGDTQLVWLMGADAALGLESWREPRRVLELARLGIARRGDVPGDEVRAVLRSLGAAGRATVVDMPRFGVSSSEVRERAAAGRPLRYLVPDRSPTSSTRGGSTDERLDSRLLARWPALADSKLAEDIVVLDMRELVSYTDFLVICTARNERQLDAVVDEVRLRLKRDEACSRARRRGGAAAGWAVLDYLDCVLHVFTPEARRALRPRGAVARRAAPRVELPTAGAGGP